MPLPYEMDFSTLEHCTETLRAIGHPLRLQIVLHLHAKERMSVTEIHEELDVEQAVASHHLRIMKDKNIVLVKREGKSSFYSLAKVEYFDLVKILLHVYEIKF